VHQGTQGDVAQRQAIACADGYILSRLYPIAALETLGRYDVGALSIQILEQGQVGAAIRVILDSLDNGGDAFLVTLEVDDPIASLVCPAAMAHGDATLVVTPAGPVLFLQQRTERRPLVELRRHHLDYKAPPRRGRICLYDCHFGFSL